MHLTRAAMPLGRSAPAAGRAFGRQIVERATASRPSGAPARSGCGPPAAVTSGIVATVSDCRSALLHHHEFLMMRAYVVQYSIEQNNVEYQRRPRDGREPELGRMHAYDVLQVVARRVRDSFDYLVESGEIGFPARWPVLRGVSRMLKRTQEPCKTRSNPPQR